MRRPVTISTVAAVIALFTLYPAASAAVTCFGAAPTQSGTSASETIDGTSGDDVIVGLGGNDTINGMGGNDLLCGGAGNDTINGSSGGDKLAGGAGDDTYNGGTGRDLAAFPSASGGVLASLLTGTAIGEGTDSLAAIENLTGSSGDDILVGNDRPNALTGLAGVDQLSGYDNGTVPDRLLGGPGDDQMDGGTGDDVLNGGTGFDTASFATSPAPVQIDLQAGTAEGDGSDTLTSIEAAEGSDQADDITGRTSLASDLDGRGGDDTIVGGDAADVLQGGLGQDTIEGNGGDDQIDGGQNGGDTILYVDAPGAVTVNLTTGLASGADGNDNIVNVANVTGSDFNDNITGTDAWPNVLVGGSGADTLSGLAHYDTLYGQAGADTLDGGVDPDTVAYNDAATVNAVNVDIDAGTASGGAGADTLISIENINGSPFGDVLQGDENPNTIYGFAGNDTLRGRAANDTLDGGDGTDTVDGGTGTGDTCYGESLFNCP